MVGEKLGSFRIEGNLGVGAMGVVYRAIHEPSGRTAAVKVVHKDISQRGQGHERFQREAEILQQFRHPNIVRFLALGRYQGTSYIAMEFIQGKTLEQILNEHEALPWKDVVDLGIQMCEALHYAHEHGVVHRDLKPSNLMITDTGIVKLTDFGIAKDLDKTALTATGRTLGTAAYMAPEQIRGTPEVSHKTDLYALGIVFYQMLTGRPPFEGSSPVVLMHCHMNEPVPRASAKVAEIPKALDDLVVKLMAKSPNDRPWDATAVGEVLKKIREKAEKGESVPMVWGTDGVDSMALTRGAETIKKPRKTTSRSKRTAEQGAHPAALTRHRLETAGLVLALLAMTGFIAYMLWPPSAPYLFKQAERLMARTDRHEWDTALTEYIDPLDKRFPDNPYKATTRAWRDKIALATVEGRARTLQSPLDTKLNQPQDPIEERWVQFHRLVTAAEKRNDDLAAEAAWKELARLNRDDDAKERPWHLLAIKQAEAERRQINQRRERVTRLLNQAQDSENAGRVDEARSIRAEVVAKEGQYTSIADLLPTPAPQPDKPDTPDAR